MTDSDRLQQLLDAIPEELGGILRFVRSLQAKPEYSGLKSVQLPQSLYDKLEAQVAEFQKATAEIGKPFVWPRAEDGALMIARIKLVGTPDAEIAADHERVQRGEIKARVSDVGPGLAGNIVDEPYVPPGTN
jgi:hypothetical protein